MSTARNIHATAIVIGTQGFLLTGPSGTGKTTLAMKLISGADARGLYSAFVGDDQVFVSWHSGQLLCEGAASIAGLAEVRGTGIVPVEHVSSAIIDAVILPVDDNSDRMPPENETFLIGDEGRLPLIRLPLRLDDPLPLLMQICSSRL